jgi:hypothetical protein
MLSSVISPVINLVHIQYEDVAELNLENTDDGSCWNSNSCEIEATASD